VTDITDQASEVRITEYDADALPGIGADYPRDGFTVLIVPGLSDIHARFAHDVQDYDGIFNSPLIGWISGVGLNEIGTRAPKCFAGGPVPLGDKAAAMHVSLPPGITAHVDIINLFEPGDGDSILFAADGFIAAEPCEVRGRRMTLAAHIAERGIDTRLPLVANYNGAMVNVSIESIDPSNGTVRFYAPVFRGIEYRFAKPIGDYATTFAGLTVGRDTDDVAFSCNCILNYAYAGLEGKRTGDFTGPVTFGEIAYILLNQTLVYLSLRPVE
jgi:hypothetical protein